MRDLEEHFAKARTQQCLLYDTAWIKTQVQSGISEDEFDKKVYELEGDYRITRENGLHLRKQFRDMRKEIDRTKQEEELKQRQEAEKQEKERLEKIERMKAAKKKLEEEQKRNASLILANVFADVPLHIK